MKKSRLLGVIIGLPSILLSHQGYAAPAAAQGDPLADVLPALLFAIVVMLIANYAIKKSNKKAGGLVILSVSLLWCTLLLLRISVLGQKFLMISGSNIWDANGIKISENLYLSVWLVGVFGICLGLWLLYSSSAEQAEKNKKKCSMCAEPVMKEAKICKHCGYEFKIE